MNCPKCKSTINDDTLVCQECGAEVAMEFQREKCEQAKVKISEAFSHAHRSGLLLACAILLIINCVIEIIISAVTVVTIITTIVTVITSIVSIVAIFKLRSGCEPTKEKMKSSTSYLNWLYIQQLISVIGTVIVSVLLLVIAIIGSSFLNSFANNDYTGEAGELISKASNLGGFALFVIAALVGGIGISLNVAIMNVYKRAREYYCDHLYMYTSGKINFLNKPSVVGLYVIGALNIITLVSMCRGIYLILLASWYNSVYNEVSTEKAVYDVERRKLSDIEQATKDYKARVENEKRRQMILKQEEEKRKIEEERLLEKQRLDKQREEERLLEKQRLDMQREEMRFNQQQQQMMMQQMMQQMMANMQQFQNGQKNNSETEAKTDEPTK